MSKKHSFQMRIERYLTEVSNCKVTPPLRVLQDWQSERLLRTHEALYSQQRFKPAMDFFKDELYSVEQFRHRNDKIIDALPLMCKTMPESVLQVVQDAAELHALSLNLDSELCNLIGEQPINDSSYQTAYRNQNRPNDRIRQIDLIDSLGNDLASIVGKPMVGRLLKWADVPARVAGYGDIHKFVCKGYSAFENMGDAREFLDPIVEKERELMKAWSAGTR